MYRILQDLYKYTKNCMPPSIIYDGYIFVATWKEMHLSSMFMFINPGNQLSLSVLFHQDLYTKSTNTLEEVKYPLKSKAGWGRNCALNTQHIKSDLTPWTPCLFEIMSNRKWVLIMFTAGFNAVLCNVWLCVQITWFYSTYVWFLETK